MHRFRGILAALLAILIVSPVCCCAAPVRVEKKAEHSCCHSGNAGGKKEKRETACDCASKTPRISEHPPVVPDAPVFTIPAPMVPPPVVLDVVSQAPGDSDTPAAIDTGPPRLRLVMLQSFLI